VKHSLKKLTKLHKNEVLKHSRFSRANLVVFAVIFASIGGYLIYSSFAAAGQELHATPATFASVAGQATGGETIYLASGDYGTWLGPGTAYTSTVTIKPEPGASPLPTMGLTLSDEPTG
jgi:hypothetical protein